MTYLNKELHMSFIDHQKWINQGYKCKDVGIVYRWGAAYTRYHYWKEISVCEQIGRFFLFIIGSLGTCCCLPCNSNSFVEGTFTYPINGFYNRLVYNAKETERIHILDTEQLGFDSNDAESLKNFAQNLNKKDLKRPMDNIIIYMIVQFQNYQ